MQPTTEILERITKNSQQHPDEVFTRLFRYMLRPDLYYTAYKKLYSNNGAATKGVDNDTADGFCVEKVDKIIKALADDSYQPKPARRQYIQKDNGKQRPLGIPTFTDKLVQEVLRMILEAIYEPIFLDCSHGFRPNRGCHTALRDVKHQFPGTRWFVEGDIKGCFDNIDHSVLMSLIGKKIKDAQIIKLLYRFLKAGYLEDWQYHSTYSGTPQGGIVSPILSNIYLHELDKFVMSLKSEFDKPTKTDRTPEYARAAQDVKNIRRRLNRCNDSEKRTELADMLKKARTVMLSLPAKSQTDKVLKYIRYADDFIIGINGSREDCVELKGKLSAFIKQTLNMELSEEKTLITHSAGIARFLGYDVSVRRDFTIKPHGKSGTQRTLSNQTQLLVPAGKIHAFIFNHRIAVQKADGTLKPCKRGDLIRLTNFEIVSTFNAEMRGFCNYYHMASNFPDMQYIAYLTEYSCLKTLAAKYRCKTSKIREMYKDGRGKWRIPYETKTGKKSLYIAKLADSREVKNPSDRMLSASVINKGNTTSFEDRLKAKVCELCGSADSEYYEIHHVNKVKNLSGKQEWERVMIAKRRKTIVICRDCHKQVHR